MKKGFTNVKLVLYLQSFKKEKDYCCETVVVAQLVRALVCGTRGRRFEPGLPPIKSLP